MKAVVIRSSAGGLNALDTLLSDIKVVLPVPMFIAQHIGSFRDIFLAELLGRLTPMKVVEAEDKMIIEPGTVYIAPANYHMLIESESAISLSIDEKVNYSRPSIDVLFESAAPVFRDRLLGVILTGASGDGAKGIAAIADAGGLTLAQKPSSAEYPTMPGEAIATGKVKLILPLPDISKFIAGFSLDAAN